MKILIDIKTVWKIINAHLILYILETKISIYIPNLLKVGSNHCLLRLKKIILNLEEKLKITIIKITYNKQKSKLATNPSSIITLINLMKMFIVMRKNLKITKNNKVVPPIFKILKIIGKLLKILLLTTSKIKMLPRR